MKKVIYIILQVVFLIVLLLWVIPATSYFQLPIDSRDGTYIYFLFLLINTSIIILLLLRVLMLIDKPKVKIEQK
ncbi:MAG: hypothetical protein WBL80_09295 [Erysipelotrichaceae bacterium]